MNDTRHTEMLQFLRDLAAQKPEKPDHWSGCSQCEGNIDRAQQLLQALPDEQQLTSENSNG